MRLSTIIITKNASKRLENTVSSVKGIVDEITIVDTGSSDDTVKIAKKLTKNVYRVTFEDDFSIVRNYALSRSIGEWILVLDADEVISPEMKEQIPELIRHRTYDGYWFRRRWYIDNKRYLQHGLFYPDFQLRLFRNSDDIKYQNRVHEEVTIVKEKTEEILADIYHYDSLHKYLAWKEYQTLSSYIHMMALMHKEEGRSSLYLVTKAIYSFLDMFFVGLTRGKGLLDGWVGIQAHFFFALSVSESYIQALSLRKDTHT
jgi:glycosyltransferase involved in cell wall biosynthesis